jgi:hypothetical protein
MRCQVNAFRTIPDYSGFPDTPDKTGDWMISNALPQLDSNRFYSSRRHQRRRKGMKSVDSSKHASLSCW